MFTSIIEAGKITIEAAITSTLAALLLGFVIARVYMLCGNYSKNFVTTLVLLPALVEIVVMMVNGNLGTGVAVLGAFSLVRFRSIPGSSREISSLFFSMAIGLAAGMGYVILAVLVTVILCVALLLMFILHFGEKSRMEQELKITIPESLDYTDVFDEIFHKYLVKEELQRVKTTNLGSMFELMYLVKLKKDISSKEMMDEIRCRNGNLTVLLQRPQTAKEEL